MSDPLIDRARAAAAAAHAGQLDKQGRDYVEAHLEPVAEALTAHQPEVVAAGWLHDIVEDTDWTVERVAEEFGPEVARAVDAVTRRADETYDELIERAAADPLGRLVKLADNSVNLAANESLAVSDPETAARLRAKYETARRRLLES
ncbi:MAG: HD domain-containing protein [Actinomycetales bacterium]|nr:MAG: HD domain-containing protein [Actinomycetales bacterium]